MFLGCLFNFVHDIWVSASSVCMILYWSQVSLGVVGVCTADAAQPRGPSEPLTSWILQPFKSPSFPFLCDFGGAEIHAVCDVENLVSFSPHLEGKYIILGLSADAISLGFKVLAPRSS